MASDEFRHGTGLTHSGRHPVVVLFARSRCTNGVMVQPGPDPDDYPQIDPTEPVPDNPGELSPDTPESLPPAPVEPMPGPDDPASVPG